MKKFKSIFISVVTSLSLIAGLLTTAGIIFAAGDANTAKAAEINDELAGLVACWTFNGDYQDTVGGLTTNLGAKKLTYIDGIYGKAAVFDGKDNYLYVDPDPILNLGNGRDENNDNFTISAWLNMGDIPGGYQYLLDKGLYTGWNGNYYYTNPYTIGFSDDGPFAALSNKFEDDNVDPYYVTDGDTNLSGKYVDGEEWFLLTVTYDGKHVKVYHDNELLMQNNYTDGIAFNNEELFIGADHTLEYYFKGAVDDLRLYDRCLSYDDVDNLYQLGLAANKELVEPTKQLVAYYPFDDDLKDASTFGNDAEKVAVGGTTKYVIGENGDAITMSKGNYILVPAADQLNFDNEFTVSFWLKLDRDGTYPILCRQNPAYTNNNDNYWTYSAYIDAYTQGENTSITMWTNVYNPDSWAYESGQTLTSQLSYQDDKIKNTNWVHYAYTYKDGQLKSFVNGVLRDKTDSSDVVNISNATGDLLIGYDGETFINGAIDELKIFNKCLTETEVSTEAKRVDSISLSTAQLKSIASIGKGKSVTISSILLNDVDTGKAVTVNYSKNNITFSSSNKKVFTVTADGKITGVKSGKEVKAKLTISYGPHSVTYSVTVK